MSEPIRGQEDSLVLWTEFGPNRPPVDILLELKPEAVRTVIDQEAANPILPHERYIENKELVELIFDKLVEPELGALAKDKARKSYLKGSGWAYALACETDMEGVPILRDGYGSRDLDDTLRVTDILDRTATFSMVSKTFVPTFEAFKMELMEDEDNEYYLCHGLLTTLYLINMGEREKTYIDTSIKSLELDIESIDSEADRATDGTTNTPKELSEFDLIVRSFYKNN